MAQRDIYKYWKVLRRAIDELFADEVDAAIVHIDESLELYKYSPKENINYRPILRNREVSPIAHLRQMEREKDAERLLLRSIQVTESVYGNPSHEKAACLAELADFYAFSRNYDQLRRYAEESIQLYAQLGCVLPVNAAYQNHYAIGVLYRTCALLQEQNETHLAKAILSLILYSQRKSLYQDDAQIAHTNVELGRFLVKNGELESSRHFYREGIKVLRNSWGSSQAVFLSYIHEYSKVLWRLGRHEGASRLLWSSNGNEEAPTKKNFVENQELLKEAHAYEASGHLLRATTCFHQAVERAQKLEPDCDLPEIALHNLAEFYSRQKKFGRAAETYKQLLLRFDEGGRMLSPRRISYLLALGQALVELKMFDEVKEIVEEARASDLDIVSKSCEMETLLAYARLELAAGLREFCSEDLAEAERKLEQELISEQKKSYAEVILTLKCSLRNLTPK